jgi:hypothetical protein
MIRIGVTGMDVKRHQAIFKLVLTDKKRAEDVNRV